MKKEETSLIDVWKTEAENPTPTNVWDAAIKVTGYASATVVILALLEVL